MPRIHQTSFFVLNQHIIKMSTIQVRSQALNTLKTSSHLNSNPHKTDQGSDQPSNKQATRPTQNQPQHQPFYLAKIIKKYKVKNISKTFISKLKRNNTHSSKNTFTLKSQQQQNQERLLKLKGIKIKYRWIEFLCFFGDILMSLFIFYISVLQAFVQGFRKNEHNNHLIIVLKVVAIVFQFSKIFLKTIKQEYYQGVRLDYITDIILYSTGLFDLFIYVSAITIIFITVIMEVTETVGIISLVIALIKIFKTSENIKVLELYYINSTRKQQYWNLIKIVIFNIFFGHLIAGILVGISQFNTSHNWIITHHLQEQSWDVIYSWAVYWSATMITTTGFGDYAATNQHEAIVIAILEFVSSVVLVYNINLIGTIVMQIREADQLTQKKLAVFHRMNEETPIDTFLEKKIHSYIEFQKNLHELFEFQERQHLMQDIPNQLKLEYFNEVNQAIFRTLPFFRHIRADTMNTLASAFQSSVFYPSQYIIKNKIGKDFVFILKKGRVGLAYQKIESSINGTIVQTMKTCFSPTSEIKDSPILLTNSFLSRTKDINYDMVALDYSLIMKIKLSDLLNIIRTSQLDKEHYFTIYDKQQLAFIFKNELCEYCPKEYHNKFQCPKLHFMPFKSMVIHKQLQGACVKNAGFRNYKRTYLRKEHCYYLRKEFYVPYQEMRSIKSNKDNNKAIFGQEFDNAFKDAMSCQSLSKEDFLQKCESIFRKVFDQKFQDDFKDENSILRTGFDVAHNYLSYFHELNPDKLLRIRLAKKKKLQTRPKSKFDILGAGSNRWLYRRSKTLELQHEKELLRASDNIKRETSLKLVDL